MGPTSSRRTWLVLPASLILMVLATFVKADESTPSTPLTSVAGTVVQSLDGPWKIADDAAKNGEAGGWFKPGSFPMMQARPIEVPGVPTEVFPINAWWSDPATHPFWYYRTFTGGAASGKGMRLYLRFGAVRQTSDIWLNGEHLGTHIGGEDPFEFDVTTNVKPGENTLVVRIQMNIIGGIWQGVELVAQPDVRVMDAFAKPDIKGRKIDLELTIENNSGAPANVTARASVAAAKAGKTLAAQSSTITVAPGLTPTSLVLPVAKPHVWDLDDPFLYRVTVGTDWKNVEGTAHDGYSFRTGFRDFRMVDGFFQLNGRRIFPACAHGNNYDPIGLQGTSRRMTYMIKELENLKKGGFNMMRCIVAAALPEQLDWADEQGILFFTEHETSWIIKDPKDFGRTLNQVVRRDRNHPSLVLYGLLNETDNLDIYKKGRDWLPQVREIDDTRPVLLSSGRWDRDFKTASLCNTGSHTWDTYMGGEDPVAPKNTSPDESVGGAFKNGTGDAHIYTTWPTTYETMAKFLALAKDTHPFFLSEEGMGTSYDPIVEAQELDRLKVPHDLFCWSFPGPGVEGMKKVWADAKLADTYPDMHDFIVDSDLSGARQRALIFTMVRGNPQINGYNLTSIEDFWGGAEGIMNNFRDYKPGTLQVMREGWAPLRWCLVVNPTAGYTGQPLRVRVILANLDVLPAGDHGATVTITGPGGEVWKKPLTVHVIDKGPLAYPLFNEDVTLPNLKPGKYSLKAVLSGHKNATANHYDFTLTDRGSLPKLKGTFSTLGLPANVAQLLTQQGAQLREFVPATVPDNEVIVVGGGFKGAAKDWRALYSHAARGAHIVFLDEKVFQGGQDPNHWFAVPQKGVQNMESDWLYHKDCIAKKGSPAFAGLPTKLMDPDDYGLMLADAHFFMSPTIPDDIAAVGIRSTLSARYEFKGGVMIGTYKLGAGRFTINAFNLQNTIGHPATDRLLLNLVSVAQADAAKAAPLPADFDATLDKLGIVDPPPEPEPAKK